MAQKEITTCDFCDTVKKDTNHWFKVVMDGEALFVCSQAGKVLANGKDACGEECVASALSQWLTAQARAAVLR